LITRLLVARIGIGPALLSGARLLIALLRLHILRWRRLRCLGSLVWSG
jgi:hypothetical protein